MTDDAAKGEGARGARKHGPAQGAMMRLQRSLRSSEASFILLAVAVGILAGFAAIALGYTAYALQTFLYGLKDGTRLSAMPAIPLQRLIALPLGGALIGITTHFFSRGRTPVDVVEANALHGGRIPWRDTVFVSGQTLLSNGFGASVGLEAAYGQLGGGIASVIGRWLNLRRNDMRTLVGAGTGAALAAAFGAPLMGAFYAFEIVMGAYTPAAIAPVVAASLSAAVAARALGATPYLITVAGTHDIHTGTYFLSAGLGILCALIGIALMRLVTLVETQLRRLPVSDALRPALGGFLLIPVVFYVPQALSGGHGALHLTFISEFSLGWLIAIAAAKLLGIVLSLGFGFRGGLFFASLVLGGLLGEIFAHLLAFIPGPALLSVNDAALIGMAAMTATVVGGPMTMSLLILEVTHDFEITATVLTAALCATTLVRERFGYSFSTWRLHLRGEVIKSARDIGWARSLTAGRMMRQAPATASTGLTIAGFRELFPLGSTSRVLLEDETGRYAGIVPTAAVYADTGDETRPASELRILEGATLTPEMDIAQVMRRFDDSAADDMAVVDRRGNILGILTEKYVRKRYADELDKAQRELFGET